MRSGNGRWDRQCGGGEQSRRGWSQESVNEDGVKFEGEGEVVGGKDEVEEGLGFDGCNGLKIFI